MSLEENGQILGHYTLILFKVETSNQMPIENKFTTGSASGPISESS